MSAAIEHGHSYDKLTSGIESSREFEPKTTNEWKEEI